MKNIFMDSDLKLYFDVFFKQPLCLKYKGGGGGRMPTPPDPTPVPTAIDESVIRKSDSMRKKFAGKGRQGTILTPMGEMGSPEIGRATLLGLTI